MTRTDELKQSKKFSYLSQSKQFQGEGPVCIGGSRRKSLHFVVVLKRIFGFAMVYYFKSVGADGSFESNPRFIYMGKDKIENEDLIKYGFDEDVWFHVDNLSSAHVYLRLDIGEKWDQIPEALLQGE